MCQLPCIKKKTIVDLYPLPTIKKLFVQFYVATIFSQIDLYNNYYQPQIYPPKYHKTAFTYWYAIYQFNVMAFGFCNAPNIFHYVIYIVFFNMLDNTVFIYLDDILVYNKDTESHSKALNAVF